jgi:uncharacterized protein YpmB
MILILFSMLIIVVIGYSFYRIFTKEDAKEVEKTDAIKIKTEVTKSGCCSVFNASEAAYCHGGWAKENLDDRKWTLDKCNEADSYLEECDKKYESNPFQC